MQRLFVQTPVRKSSRQKSAMSVRDQLLPCETKRKASSEAKRSRDPLERVEFHHLDSEVE